MHTMICTAKKEKPRTHVKTITEYAHKVIWEISDERNTT